MPNLQNWKKLEERIASLPEERTNMHHWFSIEGIPCGMKPLVQHKDECGTTFCMAGHAAALAVEEGWDSKGHLVSELGAKFLGDSRNNPIFFSTGREWTPEALALYERSPKEGTLMAVRNYIRSLEQNG